MKTWLKIFIPIASLVLIGGATIGTIALINRDKSYTGNADGTNWKGYVSGSLTTQYTKTSADEFVSVTSTNDYVAKNLVVPDKIKLDDGTVSHLCFIDLPSHFTVTGSLTFQNSMRNIGAGAFTDNKITSLNLSKVTIIGTAAFSGCTGLTKLDLTNVWASIGLSAFANCTSLTGNLTIPKELADSNWPRIDSFAFLNDKFTSLTFKDFDSTGGGVNSKLGSRCFFWLERSRAF